MTSTVKKLAAKDFVALRTDPRDRRARRVEITAAGEAARAAGVAALAPVREEAAREAPELDFEALLPALTAIRVFLDARR
ncbi:MAG: hypothetical protein ACLFQ5_06570 [Oceanicaulis sp.]